jgi:hypothetical protein
VPAAKADLLAALTALEKVLRLLIAGAAGTYGIEQSPTLLRRHGAAVGLSRSLSASSTMPLTIVVAQEKWV